MLSLRFLLPFIIFLQTTDCKDSDQPIQDTMPEIEQNEVEQTSQESFESVVMEYYGGMRGERQVMIITKDDISYSYKDLNNEKPLIQKEATPSEVWTELNQGFNLNEFRNLKSGSSKVVFDGMDYIFTVKGGFGELKVTNPLDHDIEMKNFFENLKNIMQEFHAQKEE
ncbi:hypothetical protein NMK71_03225 [Weeksellaceae bacterium KMM 9713]|uniref:Uncharacterized protein n=1 Tax=Profundicola chukchiensis TaxID=2961959 RepID=A0A9X4N2E0_9FLAO|nr:hypothetical protein [Profundicola chukchiensis]MDG4945414.1 hypothetical protein [Profundicola chukchiensis]